MHRMMPERTDGSESPIPSIRYSAVSSSCLRTLDRLGRVAQVQPAGLEPTSFTYDLRGRLATLTRGTGPAAHTSTFSYL